MKHLHGADADADADAYKDRDIYLPPSRCDYNDLSAPAAKLLAVGSCCVPMTQTLLSSPWALLARYSKSEAGPCASTEPHPLEIRTIWPSLNVIVIILSSKIIFVE